MESRVESRVESRTKPTTTGSRAKSMAVGYSVEARGKDDKCGVEAGGNECGVRGGVNGGANGGESYGGYKVRKRDCMEVTMARGIVDSMQTGTEEGCQQEAGGGTPGVKTMGGSYCGGA